MSLRPTLALAPLLVLLAPASLAQQTCYSGICFPQGDVSFADALLRYEPAYSGLCVPTNPNFNQGTSALGPPDYSGSTGSVSLGSGGLLEVAFVDNALTNSGSPADDLHVFEIGALVESSDVAVRPGDPTTRGLLLAAGLVDANGDGFFEVGSIGGSVASLDLDAWAPGFAPGQLLFDAVQLIDDPNQQPSCNATVGADIDAIGAISTSALPPLGSAVCSPALPNSSGMPGRIDGFGSAVAADNDVFLLASSLPTDSFGYFICSQTSAPPVQPPGSQGQICLGGSIGRYNGFGQIQRTGFSGTFGLELDLTRTPQPTGFVAVAAGETWHYQTWHRDTSGGSATSNFTDTLRIQFL